MYMRVPSSVSHVIDRTAPHLEYCPLHDIYDNEKDCMLSLPPSLLVLYPLLEPGDRVIRGPDWQWADQGGGSEGTVVRRKDWKGQKDKGVGL